MCMIIDFVKYKADKEIDYYFSTMDDTNLKFCCPDCDSTDFEIYLDMRAKCSSCELEVILTVEDDE